MSITRLKFEPTEPIWECEWGKGCPDCFHMCAVFLFFFVSLRLILFLSDLQAIRLIMHWGI